MESAVSNVVGRLLAGVITTTRHARMYSLHTLAWSAAHERNLNQAEAEELVRRCEVAMAGIHHFHEQHRHPCSMAGPTPSASMRCGATRAAGSVGAVSDTCEYPSCEAPAAGWIGVHVQPKLIEVNLCKAHLAVVRSNVSTPDTRDFWRWFMAMSGSTG